MKILIPLLLGCALALSAGCRSAEPEAQTTQASQTAALPEIRYFMIADT